MYTNIGYENWFGRPKLGLKSDQKYELCDTTLLCMIRLQNTNTGSEKTVAHHYWTWRVYGPPIFGVKRIWYTNIGYKVSVVDQYWLCKDSDRPILECVNSVIDQCWAWKHCGTVILCMKIQCLTNGCEKTVAEQYWVSTDYSFHTSNWSRTVFSYPILFLRSPFLPNIVLSLSFHTHYWCTVGMKRP